MGDRSALVLGAGVSGLTTAYRLQDDGWQVRIWTAAEPDATTSAVAAAIWYPYRVEPRDRALAWGRRSYERFAALAQDPSTGVVMTDGLEVFREPRDPPWWVEAVPDVRRADPDDLPDGFADGLVMTLPVIEMPVYLAWLLRRFVSRGGELVLHEVGGLDEVVGRAALVVNCTGLASRDLVDDGELRSVRGQVVRVANPGIRRFVLHQGDPVTYVIPRSRDLVLGGTAEEGAWELSPDPAVAEEIRRRCEELDPRIAQLPVVGHAVGLRPGRPAVRLEREELDGTVVIHDYGHGGAGVTLSWGCADDVVELAGRLGRPVTSGG